MFSLSGFCDIEIPAITSAKEYILADSKALCDAQYDKDLVARVVDVVLCNLSDTKLALLMDYPDLPVEVVDVEAEVVAPLVVGSLQVYIDNSNITAGMDDTPIKPRELHQCITGGRHMTFGMIVGSFPKAGDPYWKEWESIGYTVKVSPGGAEHGVDETLHANIYNGLRKRRGIDYVIVTGDGNSNGNLSNFPDCFMTILETSSVRVDQWSWKNRRNKVFDGIRDKYPSKYCIFNLDTYKGNILRRI